MRTTLLLCVVPLALSAQTAPPPSAPLLSPDQVDTLIAPIALYPDPLLAQVLAASTYPLEIVEAGQWIQQQRGLSGPQLIDAAKQQNWDPSVQAMVAFPDALALLTRDVRWTTDLGNAFLAQQSDVMAAVQRMRARAQSNGRLENTPQQTVSTEYDNGQNEIAIQPANPQVVYVPAYNPSYVWGPPVWGSYAPLYYPSSGISFGPAVFLGSLFAGLLSFGGWGWGLSWLTHGLFLNGLFFSHFGFGGGGFGGFGGTSVWAHNPVHRLGVAYPSRIASRYSGGGRFAGSGSGSGWRSFNIERSFNNERSFNTARNFSSAPSQNWHSFQSGGESYRGSSNREPQRMANNFRNSSGLFHFSESRAAAPRYSAPHSSAPRSSGGGGGHFSAPHASHSGSSHSGGHSGGHSSHGSSKHR